jgi:hypothetical protein
VLRLLPELGSADWVIRIAAATIMLLAGTAAATMAASRVTRVEPTRALRGD